MRENGECSKTLWKLNEFFDFFDKLIIEDPTCTPLQFITPAMRATITTYFHQMKLIPRLIHLIGRASGSGGGAFNKALKVIVHLAQ